MPNVHLASSPLWYSGIWECGWGKVKGLSVRDYPVADLSFGCFCACVRACMAWCDVWFVVFSLVFLEK